MRLRATSTRLGGRAVSACFLCDARMVTTDTGNALLVIHDRPIPPGDRREADYEMVEASATELSLLRRSGYRADIYRAPRPYQ